MTDAARKETTLGYGVSSCPSCGGGADNLSSVRNARLQTTTYSYNKLGRLEYETDPLGKKYHYTRYPSGALKARYDAAITPEKLLVRYFYDPEDRLVRKQYSDGTPDTTYTYDANGRLATAANGTISYTLSYYPSGNNKGRLQSITDNSGRQISYDDYTILGQRTQVTILKGDPDARTLTYQYDGANRPWKITSGAGTFTYGYDNLGRRQTTAYPNGVTASYTYDDLDRLTGLSHANGATAIAFATYGSYDKTDNVKSITTKTGTTSYDYDPLYRLIRAATPNGTENYGYDEVGNRLTGPGPKDTRYSYNAANQATQGAIYGHDFDNAGNQTTRTTTNPDKSWNLTWNYDNQLIRSEQTKGQEKRTVTFKYDPFDRRIEKKLTTVIRGITKTSTWSYLYDGDDIALEIYTDPSGAAEKTYYTQGAGIDEHLALERNGSYYYYHSDALGSITAITDQSRAVVQGYDYDSFGAPKQATGFKNGYQYTGREWDRETQLYYYRARYYDPKIGRFIQKDPIGFAGGDVNLYGYVQNNPVNWIDPTGLLKVHYGNATQAQINTFNSGLEVLQKLASYPDSGASKYFKDTFGIDLSKMLRDGYGPDVYLEPCKKNEFGITNELTENITLENAAFANHMALAGTLIHEMGHWANIHSGLTGPLYPKVFPFKNPHPGDGPYGYAAEIATFGSIY